ncbi:MAG: hypothetical protein WBC05_19505 [Sedimentisphaerales bacterium]
MKNTKTMAFVVAGLLVLGGVCLLPSVSGQGPENLLVRRVEVLEELVAELSAKVDELEVGSCTCTILNLQPLADFPGNPSEGDLCVVWTEYLPGDFGNIPYCYVLGEWNALLSYNPPLPDPRQ